MLHTKYDKLFRYTVLILCLAILGYVIFDTYKVLQDYGKLRGEDDLNKPGEPVGMLIEGVITDVKETPVNP
jgi:hypothetical protein